MATKLTSEEYEGLRQQVEMQALVDRQNRRTLTVSDVERLAKAGVQMNFADIAKQIEPDGYSAPVPMPQPYSWYDRQHDRATPMLRPLFDRLQRAGIMPKEDRNDFYGIGATLDRLDRHTKQDGSLLPFFSAAATKETVYVFFAPPGEKPMILEDDILMFPSDALVAKFLLWKHEHGGNK